MYKRQGVVYVLGQHGAQLVHPGAALGGVAVSYTHLDVYKRQIHLHVENGGIDFVNSPCPDHTCEGFGVLKNQGDWAACMPAKASLTIE